MTAVDIQINTVITLLLQRNGTHIGTSVRPNNGRSHFISLCPWCYLNLGKLEPFTHWELGVFRFFVKYQLYAQYARFINGFSVDVFDIASRYSPIVEEQIAASVVFAHCLQFPFFMTLHGPVQLLCRVATTRTQLCWLPPFFTQAADACHAEARSLIDEVLTKASAIFPPDHKRPEAVDLQLYRSDWHSCLELVDFPLHHN